MSIRNPSSSSERAPHSLLQLIVLRFVLVCFIVVSAWLGLPQAASISGFLLPFFSAVSVLTAVYLLLWKYAERADLFWVQLLADLVLQTVLLYFTGGLQSIFTPLYVLIIVYASLVRGRPGGVLALIISLLSYVLIVLLAAAEAIPNAAGLPPDFLYQLVVNLLAFVSVAFLGIYLSERLSSARRELGAAQVLQENIIDNIRSGLCTLDLAGKITFFNRIGGEILGRPREDLKGLPLSQVFPPQIFGRILDSDFDLTSRALRMEGWVERAAGERVFLGLGCSPLLDRDQKVAGYIVSFQDLTEIKRREDELQFRNKMAAIGEMAAGLAHELRNPLASLSGSIQILESELDLSPEQARLLGIVLRESERLNRIVGDFLAYAGPQPAELKPVDLGILVKETVQLFCNNPEFEKERHRLDLEQLAPRVECKGNPDQLRQVVWNIFQNAIRAMPDGGSLWIQLDHDEDTARMRFRDEGVGMNSNEREKLFQPFHSGFRKGAGLGMAIVYQIVQQHSGEIHVESSPKKGTEITIELPRE